MHKAVQSLETKPLGPTKNTLSTTGHAFNDTHIGDVSLYLYIHTIILMRGQRRFGDGKTVLGILTWHRGNRDRGRRCPHGEALPLHYTVGLTRAIIPNVDDSGVQFMLVGDCVRAIP